MHRIGEDRAERLDVVPAQLRMQVTIRPRYACRGCTDGVHQRPAPDHAIPGGLPTEALLAQVEIPALQRDLHLQIGQAGIELKQPLKRLLPHLVAADRVGGISGTAHEDLIVQIGVLSLRAGLPAQAKDYFERYLAEYPDNVRAWTIKRQLADAEQQLKAEDSR